jgi:hypothetical protein
MRRIIGISFGLALSSALVACPSTPSGSDSGMTASDAAGDVAACEALARTFRDNCEETNGPTDERVCLWESYARLCRIGNTALLLDAMECLDESTCRTFSDANDGVSCLQTLHATQQPAALRSFIEGQCAACGGTDCSAGTATAEIFPYVLASDAPALDTCTTSETCMLPTIVTACSSVPAVAAFAACTL